MFEKTVARMEAFFKGMMFDCKTCGQCVLSKTGLICPMSCPKGLRNGPCGGTLNGECEVYPDKECVWVRIHNKTSGNKTELPPLLRSPDSNLWDTSSYLNLLKGKDKESRKPLEYLNLNKNKKSLPIQTLSILEHRLKEGHFVWTTEIRSPREANFLKFRKEAELIKGKFDAVNVTAYLNGRPSIPSPRASYELKRVGLEPIAQATCRDHTKTSFISELIHNDMNGVNNILCLTGDSYVGTPKIKQVFDMDSSLMLYEAKHLREKKVVHFTGDKMKNPPKPFLGAAINPYTQPSNIPIIRLKQKSASGADFIQTQLLFESKKFAEIMARFCEEGLDKELFLIAGIPVVISEKALKMVPQIPGVWFPEEVSELFNNSGDLRKTGIEFAVKLIHEIKQIPGVSGVHLMLFGADHSALVDVKDQVEGAESSIENIKEVTTSV